MLYVIISLLLLYVACLLERNVFNQEPAGFYIPDEPEKEQVRIERRRRWYRDLEK